MCIVHYNNGGTAAGLVLQPRGRLPKQPVPVTVVYVWNQVQDRTERNHRGRSRTSNP